MYEDVHGVHRRNAGADDGGVGEPDERCASGRADAETRGHRDDGGIESICTAEGMRGD